MKEELKRRIIKITKVVIIILINILLLSLTIFFYKLTIESDVELNILIYALLFHAFAWIFGFFAALTCEIFHIG